jgi:DNA topoisomerase-1
MGRRGKLNGHLSPAVEEDLLSANLRYVSDQQPGIRRRKAGRGFSYVAPGGETIRNPAVLKRIRSLVIPPAWTDVWISPIANGHIQAVGRDSKGRRQYRYHPRWREVRDENKFGRSLAFAEALPAIRDAVDRDLSLPGLPRQKVLATVVRLLDTTLARVGNQEYARQNQSFGLTTLRSRHVELNGSSARFVFKGKSGKEQDVTVHDRRVARVIRDCLDLPGYELFQYLDENGQRSTVDASDVNEYLREISGSDFTAKDFRTWAGTVLAAQALLAAGAADRESEARSNVVAAVAAVASRLGNTPAVARSCYIHPLVIQAYTEGTLFESLSDSKHSVPDEIPDEALVCSVLRSAAPIAA